MDNKKNSSQMQINYSLVPKITFTNPTEYCVEYKHYIDEKLSDEIFKMHSGEPKDSLA